MKTVLLDNKLFKNIYLKAAKWPLIFLILGILFTAASLFNNMSIFANWLGIFKFTDKIGTILIALAVISFFYNFIAILSLHYEVRLAPKHYLSAMILKSIRQTLRLIAILVSLNIIFMLLSPNGFYDKFLQNVVNIMIIAAIGWIVIQIIYNFEAVLYQRMATLTNRDNGRAKTIYTKMHILRNIATFVIIVITISAILMTFSSVRNIGISLLASAGFLTALVGLSAQKTLFSLFSGIQIALSQTIRIGDVIVMENATGIIEEITFTYVILKLDDKRRLIIPINYFIEKPFENWSRDHDSLCASIYLYLNYSIPLTPLREKFESILKNSKYWNQETGKLQISNTSAQTVEIRMQVSAENADDLSELRAEIRENMLIFLREHYPESLPAMKI